MQDVLYSQGFYLYLKKGLGDSIVLGRHNITSWIIFPLGELNGKKLLKYSNGLKDKSLEIKEDIFSSLRNGGAARFYAGNFTLPSSSSILKENDELDTFVRLDGFTKVKWALLNY